MSEPEPTTEELAVHQDYEAMMAHRRAETEKKPDYTRVGRRHEATAQRLRDLQQRAGELEEVAEKMDVTLANLFWTSDDLETQRQGDPDDGDAPEDVCRVWKELRDAYQKKGAEQ